MKIVDTINCHESTGVCVRLKFNTILKGVRGDSIHYQDWVFPTTRRGRVKRTALNNIYQKELYRRPNNWQKELTKKIRPEDNCCMVTFVHEPFDKCQHH